MNQHIHLGGKVCSLALSIVAMLAILASLDGCKRLSYNPDPAFAQFVEQYTGGIIPDNGSIRIQFSYPMMGEGPSTPELLSKAFSFFPSLPGEASWSSPSENK